MEIAVIISKKDLAGMNVKEKLITHQGFQKNGEHFDGEGVYTKEGVRIYTLSSEHITRESLDKEINADVFVFATKHRSESGAKSLCVHAPGNWGKAEMGGQDKKLCVAPTQLMGSLLRALETNKPSGFDVVLEATHHGPFMQKPVCFIEIGSNETEWVDELAGVAVAKSIIEGITAFLNGEGLSKSAIGIGGPHYCPNYKRLIINSEYSVGHVCPKYALEQLDEEMLRQAIEKTHPTCDLILVDWKGLGKEKEKIINLLQKNDFAWERIN